MFANLIPVPLPEIAKETGQSVSDYPGCMFEIYPLCPEFPHCRTADNPHLTAGGK